MRIHSTLLHAGLVTVLIALSGCKSDEAIEPQSDVAAGQSPLSRQSALVVPVPTSKPSAIVADAVVKTNPGSPPPVTSRPLANSVASTSSGQEFIVVGGIVADVNGEPIYAHELLSMVAPALRARAADADEGRFRKIATDELLRQRDNLIRDKLVFAAAQRNTDAQDDQRAKLITSMTRDRLVSEAGGSEAIARQRVKDRGDDFDKLLETEYRRNLTRLYYTKRIFPRAEVSGDEMRRYYERNINSRFSESGEITFRVIKIDVTEVGDESLARQRAQDARSRLLQGEEFETVA